ncbi:MAG: T9SS type A sorting domain-containing protein [Bacteroidota bacterium]|nr:T9SS type A sorting domain-containing protein [Bacteroidota bacterium]
MIKTFTTKSILNSLALSGAFFLTSYNAEAQFPLTTLGAPYSQDFDALANTGTANVLAISGWVIDETGGGARDNELYAGDTGGSNTGDTYSYGTAATTERALGSLASGTLISSFGSSFANNTGSLVTDLVIGYTGEQWRLAVIGRQDSLLFQYSLDATSLTTGTWVSVPALNFKSPFTAGPTGALDGDAGANRTSILSAINGLNIPNGSTFWIRWTDPNITGSDDGLAVDDLTLVPMFTNNISVSDVVLAEGNAGLTSFDFTVSLSSPADIGGVTFDISTTDGSATSPIDFISNSLTGQTIPAGMTSYTFSVMVNGDLSPEMNDTFYVNVINAAGASIADGQGLGIIVNEDFIAPLVTSDPQPQTVCNGSMASFSSTATGDPAPTVQWQVSTDGGTNWNDVVGATQPLFQFIATSADSGDYYRAVFTNGGGGDTCASALLTVNPTYSISASDVVCSGSDYTFPDGFVETNITSTVVHVSNFTTVATSCDSVITTTVDVNLPDSITDVQTICAGDTMDFYGTGVFAAGLYYHTLTNMAGCDSVIELDLSVAPLPTVTFDYMGGAVSSICVEAEDTVFLNGGLPTGGMYFGMSADTVYAQFLVDNFGQGMYYFDYWFTDVNGCSNVATDSLFFSYCIGIKEQHVSGIAVSVYPNPAKDKVTVEFATELKSGKISILNTLGQTVLTAEIRNANMLELDLNNINKGVYFIQIENDGSKTVERLIVE